MLWKVRFKFKQMMHEHVLETITDSQAEADALAEHYLGEKFGSPNVRMVPPVEPFVAMRSREVPALAAKYGAPAAVDAGHTSSAVEPVADPPPVADSGQVLSSEPDDEMTAMAGPLVSKANRTQKPRIGA